MWYNVPSEYVRKRKKDGRENYCTRPTKPGQSDFRADTVHTEYWASVCLTDGREHAENPRHVHEFAQHRCRFRILIVVHVGWPREAYILPRSPPVLVTHSRTRCRYYTAILYRPYHSNDSFAVNPRPRYLPRGTWRSPDTGDQSRCCYRALRGRHEEGTTQVRYTTMELGYPGGYERTRARAPAIVAVRPDKNERQRLRKRTSTVGRKWVSDKINNKMFHIYIYCFVF